MKKFLLGVLVGGLIFGSIPLVAAIEEYICYKADYKVVINGQPYEHPELPILNYKGNTYAPFRSVLEAAGLNVNWNAELNQAEVNNMDNQTNNNNQTIPVVEPETEQTVTDAVYDTNEPETETDNKAVRSVFLLKQFNHTGKNKIITLDNGQKATFVIVKGVSCPAGYKIYSKGDAKCIIKNKETYLDITLFKDYVENKNDAYIFNIPSDDRTTTKQYVISKAGNSNIIYYDGDTYVNASFLGLKYTQLPDKIYILDIL